MGLPRTVGNKISLSSRGIISGLSTIGHSIGEAVAHATQGIFLQFPYFNYHTKISLDSVITRGIIFSSTFTKTKILNSYITRGITKNSYLVIDKEYQ